MLTFRVRAIFMHIFQHISGMCFYKHIMKYIAENAHISADIGHWASQLHNF